jgi:hypothetical protein
MLVSSEYFRDLGAPPAAEPIKPDVHYLSRKVWLYIAAAVLAAMLLLLHRQLWTAWVWVWN